MTRIPVLRSLLTRFGPISLGFTGGLKAIVFFILQIKTVTGCVYMCPIITTTTPIKYGVVVIHHPVILCLLTCPTSPPNLDTGNAQDILTALNNINSSVNTADQEARKRLEAINNSINNNYNDLTRPSDSDVSSASGTLSDTSDVKAATGLFTSIDNITQGVFNLFTNPGSTTLTFPGFGMEIDGVSYNVWVDTKYNLSDLDNKFGGLLSVVRFATSLLVYLALIRYLVNTYHRIFGEGE